MKILIDMQACQNGSRFRGIGRYTTGIVTEILKQAQPKHECHLLLNGLFPDNIDQLIGYFDDFVKQENIHVWFGLSPAEGNQDFNFYRITCNEVVRDAYIQNLAPDLVFMPTFFEGHGDNCILTTKQFFAANKVLMTATCHDLIPLLQADVYLADPHFKTFYLNQVKDFVQADGFLAVSNSSKLELNHAAHVPLEKIVNTSEGVEERFSKGQVDLAEIEKLLGIKNIANKKIILYSGASDERKNHAKLIEAFSLLERRIRNNALLVFAGGMPNEHMEHFRNIANKYRVTNNELLMPGRLSDDEMIALYRACYVFIFPSYHEGFGLPALEAMACGAPVLASNTTSLPEVVGREDLLFDPYSALSIKNKLTNFLGNEAKRNEAATYCYNRAQEFSWAKSAKIALDFFEKLYKEKNNSIQHQNSIDNYQILAKLFEMNIVQELTPGDKENLALALIKNNRPISRKARLYIDLTYLVEMQFVTGVQRVTKELFTEIQSKYADTYEIVPIQFRPQDRTFEEVSNTKYARAIEDRLSHDDLMDFSDKDIFIALDLNYNIAGMADTIDRMKRRGCKVYFFIHDLLPLKLGVSFFDNQVAHLQFNWLKQAIKADGIIAISKTVMEDVKNYLDMFNGYIDKPFSQEKYKIYNQQVKLAYSYHGANFKSNYQKNNETENFIYKGIDFSKRTFIMVGSIEPRKGHLDVINVFTQLWEQGVKVNLVIVAARNWNTDKTIDLIESSNFYEKYLFWLKNVNDEELSYLYTNSDALIAASIDEGFGLPIIEALNYDIDVICRDIPIFREVGSDWVSYFKNNQALKKLIENFTPRHAKVKPKLLTWRQSADNLMDIVLNNNFIDSWSFSNKHYLMPVFSEKFDTSVGSKSWDCIKTSNSAGLFLYGGWIDLDAGDYEFKLLGYSEKLQNVKFEIVTVQENTLVRLAVISNLQINQSSLGIISEVISRGNFRLSYAQKRVEFYISIDVENEFDLSYLEIFKLT